MYEQLGIALALEPAAPARSPRSTDDRLDSMLGRLVEAGDVRGEEVREEGFLVGGGVAGLVQDCTAAMKSTRVLTGPLSAGAEDELAPLPDAAAPGAGLGPALSATSLVRPGGLAPFICGVLDRSVS